MKAFVITIMDNEKSMESAFRCMKSAEKYGLHAGDYFFVDAPEISTKDTKIMDKQFGGGYVIAKLCHYISLRDGGYTKLTLCRDSLGRKGSPLPS